MDGWNIATTIGTFAAAVVPPRLFLLERRDRIATQKRLRAEIADRGAADRRRAEQELRARVRMVSVFNRVSSETFEVAPGEHVRIVYSGA